MLAPGGHAAHVHVFIAQRVHADAVAEQCSTRTAPRWVDRQYGDFHVRETLPEAVEQFVGDRRLAGAAGAGYAKHRSLFLRALPFAAFQIQLGLAENPVFQR